MTEPELFLEVSLAVLRYPDGSLVAHVREGEDRLVEVRADHPDDVLKVIEDLRLHVERRLATPR